MISIAPLLSSEVDELRKASEADAHGLFFQSHLIRKEGEIVGSFSQCVPVHTIWLHTQKLSGVESFNAIKRVEEYMRMAGRGNSLALCSIDSPFFDFMPRLSRRETFRGALFAPAA